MFFATKKSWPATGTAAVLAIMAAWALKAMADAWNLADLSHQFPLEQSPRSEGLFDRDNASAYFLQFHGRIKPHYHKKHDEIVIFLSGSGTFVIGGQSHRLRNLSLYHINKGMAHEAVCDAGEICKAYSIFLPRWNPKKPDRVFVTSP